MQIELGIDVFLKEHLSLVKGKRVALLAHGASVTSTLKPTPLVFHEHPQINLALIFGPEHGLFGTEQDMESVRSSLDPMTGVEVTSLYGETVESLKPHLDDLKKFDVLICDLQDIGVRYYTYIYSLAMCMEACAQAKIPVIVLDRPNPINGLDIEGNILDEKFKSFVGYYPLPTRHGMTIGELAKYFNEHHQIGASLTVIPMKNWERQMYFDQIGLDFLPPSPNMPWVTTSLVYPGSCLFEATNVSEGRGTTMPFEWIGAPFIQPREWSDYLNTFNWPGVTFRPLFFKPNFQKWASGECGGVQIHITNRSTYKPYQTGLWMLASLAKLYPQKFKWRDKPYEFVTNLNPVDMLTGSSEFRKNILDASAIQGWINSWDDKLVAFKTIRKKYLLY